LKKLKYEKLLDIEILMSKIILCGHLAQDKAIKAIIKYIDASDNEIKKNVPVKFDKFAVRLSYFKNLIVI
jgi:hypothetical protein